MNPGEQFKIDTIKEYRQAEEMFKDRFASGKDDIKNLISRKYSYILNESNTIFLFYAYQNFKTIPSPLKPQHEVLKEEPCEEFTGDEFLTSKECENRINNKYSVKCKGVDIDVYNVLKAFEVTDPAIQHAVKKLLKPGQRGVKTKEQDLQEAIKSIERSIELISE